MKMKKIILTFIDLLALFAVVILIVRKFFPISDWIVYTSLGLVFLEVNFNLIENIRKVHSRKHAEKENGGSNQ